jgi:hypothetical protein
VTEPGAASVIVATCDQLLIAFDSYSATVKAAEQGGAGLTFASGVVEGLEQASTMVRGIRSAAVEICVANAQRLAAR